MPIIATMETNSVLPMDIITFTTISPNITQSIIFPKITFFDKILSPNIIVATKVTSYTLKFAIFLTDSKSVKFGIFTSTLNNVTIEINVPIR